MASTNPRFTVKISIPRNPSVFSMDHISRFVTENRFTAPKYYDIWVLLIIISLLYRVLKQKKVNQLFLLQIAIMTYNENKHSIVQINILYRFLL